MEKIVLAIDIHNMDMNAISFACYLSRITHSTLTAVFLDNLVVEADVAISEAHAVVFVDSISVREIKDSEDVLADKQKNIALFKEITAQEGIRSYVIYEKGLPAVDIIAKSRFADVVIVDATTSFTRLQEGPPTRFIKDILHDAECPVIIAPEEFNGIDNIVFCYDGSKSSVFATKQFAYLFPELENNQAKVIYLDKGNDEAIEEKQALINYLNYHYKSAEFIHLEGDATEAFFYYLMKKKNDFVVMGAYGRGLLSSFFERDANKDTRTTSLPIFVAHH